MRDRPGEADALLHPAGQLGRHELADLRAQADHGQGLDRLDLRLRPIDLPGGQEPERHVLPDRQAVEQRPALEQHAELAAQPVDRVARGADDFLAVDADRAAVGDQQAEHALDQDGLARPGTADHHQRLARYEIEVDALEHLLRAEALGQPADRDLRHGAAHRLKNSSVTA